jgi:hypothetical protein
MTEQADAHNEVKAVRVPFEDKLSYNKHESFLFFFLSFFLSLCLNPPPKSGAIQDEMGKPRSLWTLSVLVLPIPALSRR